MKTSNGNSMKENKVLIPIILMVGFIPLIVHSYVYNANLSQFDWYPSNADSQVDYFFAWKMIAIIVVGIVMLGVILLQYIQKKKFRFENSFYFFMGYALFVVMSALFSNHKYWVVRGTHALFESVWVVLAYILLCYYTYNFVNTERQVKMVLCWSGIGMAIVTLIGCFQYWGLDFFKSELGKHLIVGEKYWDQLDKLSFSSVNISYATLYNSNYLSFYFGMLIPLLLCLLIGVKKAWHRVAIGIGEIFCIICLIGCRSMSGWIALAMGGVIFLMVLCSRRKKLFGISISLLIFGTVLALIFANTTTIGKRVRDTIVGTYHMENFYSLNTIETNQDNVKLDIYDHSLYVSYDISSDGVMNISCKDENGENVEITLPDEADHMSAITDERFANVKLQFAMLDESTPGIVVYVDGIAWRFTKTNTDGYEFLNPAGKLIKYPKSIRSHLFRDDAMSNRGNIWNNAIPLLKKHIFVGAGANSYMLESTQSDYLSQAYIYGFNNYDAKAHSWYLQQWVETGLIGTLLLLIFLIWYVVQSVRIYRRIDLSQTLSWTGLGLFIAVVVYMFVAIANDSNVCTAPVFWGMLGLGLAVNRMLMERESLLLKKMSEIDKAAVADTEDNVENGVIQTAQDCANHKTSSPKKQSRKQRKKQKK